MSFTNEHSIKLKPNSQFVTKENFRQELDLAKNKLDFVKGQTFNKRQCIVGLGFSLSAIANVVLGIYLYKNQVKYLLMLQFLLKNCLEKCTRAKVEHG